jgi:hypothetical protein
MWQLEALVWLLGPFTVRVVWGWVIGNNRACREVAPR